MNKQLLIVGCGYVGIRVARLAKEEGMDVCGLIRSPESAARLNAAGISSRRVNLLDPDSLNELPTAGSMILYAAPPPGGGPVDPKIGHFCQAMQRLEPPRKFVYLSTSGVYGDCKGREVTETTPVNPVTERARRRIDAEQKLQEYADQHGVETCILRVTGIYGPDRFPLHRLIEQHPVLAEREASLTNRIHVDDLASICLAALHRAPGGSIFNVSDGHPSSMTCYFNALADCFNLPRPPQVSLAEAKQVMNPLMLSYMLESRTMSNLKMLRELQVELRFPSLADGLSASAAEMLERDPDLVERLVSRLGKG